MAPVVRVVRLDRQSAIVGMAEDTNPSLSVCISPLERCTQIAANTRMALARHATRLEGCIAMAEKFVDPSETRSEQRSSSMNTTSSPRSLAIEDIDLAAIQKTEHKEKRQRKESWEEMAQFPSRQQWQQGWEMKGNL